MTLPLVDPLLDNKKFFYSSISINNNNGLRSGYSCETQSAVTIDDLVRYDNLQIDIAILSFSKAFDTVPHNKLLLWHLHQLIKNFLCYRKTNIHRTYMSPQGTQRYSIRHPVVVSVTYMICQKLLHHRYACLRMTVYYTVQLDVIKITSTCKIITLKNGSTHGVWDIMQPHVTFLVWKSRQFISIILGIAY
jgi:hypothetical protein